MDKGIASGLDAVAEAEAAAANAVDTTGGLSVYGTTDVRNAMTARNALAAERQKYYDDLTAKLTAQRSGPSFSERMFQLSAALAQPTSRRGFGGVLANVTPVLQAQEQAKREGEDKRRDALSALAAAQLNQRMGAADRDVETALAMARIDATANKPKNPYAGAVWDAETQRWVMRPGAEGGPPVLTAEQVGQFSRDPKNRGMKFYTTDGRPMEIK